MEIDLVELFADVGGLAADTGNGIALFIDEMQDLGPADVSALCAACHEVSQQGLPLIVVGAGLPHLPAVLSATKSYSERLFRYSRIDRLDRLLGRRRACASRLATRAPTSPTMRLRRCTRRPAATPTSSRHTARSCGTWRRVSPITVADVQVAAPEAEAELAVGFFGSRYERATPAEREYLRAMAEVDGVEPDERRRRRRWPRRWAETPQSLSPARDSLLKKGLVYSGQRGRIAFTVPHFGRYLRQQEM